MQGLRNQLRKLRFVIWLALAFAIFSYVARPLKSAFWKPAEASSLCPQLLRGERAVDRFGTELVYDSRTALARSAGPEQKFGTGDDVSFICQP